MKVYNLTYFIAAIDRPMLWFNLWNLKNNLHRFNGKKIITIAKMGNDDGTRLLANLNEEERESSIQNADDLIARIQLYLDDPSIMVFHINNSMLGEAFAFTHYMGPYVSSSHTNEATVYSHTKGIRYAGQHSTRLDPRMGLWAGNLYKQIFDNFEDVESKLWNDGFASYGAYKQDGRVVIETGSPVDWHYSGANMWVRHDKFFTRNWQCPEVNRGVTEYMVPRIIETQEAYSPQYVPTEFFNSGEFYQLEAWRTYYKNLGMTIEDAMHNFGFDGDETNGFTFNKHLHV